MKAEATSKHVRVSPYKLRPFVKVVSGSSVDKALAWLKTCSVKRVDPIVKTIKSAYANAVDKLNEPDSSMSDFIVKEIRVDGGPTIKYYKPAAMGRSSVQRKRLSHVYVVVEKNRMSGD